MDFEVSQKHFNSYKHAPICVFIGATKKVNFDDAIAKQSNEHEYKIRQMDPPHGRRVQDD